MVERCGGGVVLWWSCVVVDLCGGGVVEWWSGSGVVEWLAAPQHCMWYTLENTLF